jgi:hypothetical protein
MAQVEKLLARKDSHIRVEDDELGVPGAPTGKCTVRLLDGLSRSLEV